MRRFLLPLPLLATLAGCATIIQGSTHEIRLRSTPPGATVTVTSNERGQLATATTPATLELDRTRPDDRETNRVTFLFQKEGYEPVSQELTWAPGNPMMVGLIDVATGDAYVLATPDWSETVEDLDVVLVPLRAAP